MVGYVLGLGDRHPSNLMLDRKSGKILHIDFGDCFEVAMKRERFPEKVPFRLTRMLIKALEVSGIEGTFRITCENVMKVLRANKDSLIAILTAFVHDPLISFRLLIPLIMKANKRKKFMNKQVDSESLQIKEQEKQMMDNNNNNKVNKEKMDMKKVNNGDNGDDDIELEKKRIGSAEKKLYMEFEEKEDIESDDLNKIAKMVLERIINKLQGTDFNISNILDEKLQVEKLIKQATSHENLSQSYLGWCPFW
jgi:FKBP12-rapamycin complex-associated protein